MKIQDDMTKSNLQHKVFSKNMLYTMQCRSYSVSIPYFKSKISTSWFYIEKWKPSWLGSRSQIRQRIHKYVVRFCHQNISATIIRRTAS
ncbi:hypothetical protein Lal_00025382 [Lupinus albus]|nr:hypothetical protein Lal_00025382 [Lupinus albus]